MSHSSPVQGEQPVTFTVAATVNAAQVGRIPLVIRDNQNISVRLADLIPILKPLIASELYDQLANAHAGQTYATFNELRAAGIGVRFDKHDRLLLDTP
jgi:hypothetical protein